MIYDLRLMRFYLIFSSIILSSTILTACSQSKLVQCQNIFTIADDVANQAKPLKQGSLNDLNNWLEAANKIEGAAQQMKTLTIREPQLKEYQDDLIKSYQEYAIATRDFVKAIENKDRKAAQDAKTKVEQAGKLEREVGNKLNLYCQ